MPAARTVPAARRRRGCPLSPRPGPGRGAAVWGDAGSSPNQACQQKQKAQEYLHRYFGDLKIRVYWGTCQDFAQELKSRWEEYDGK